MFVCDCKTYFEDLLETIKQWVANAKGKILAHNEEIGAIKKEVLMTVQEMIDQAIEKTKEEFK